MNVASLDRTSYWINSLKGENKLHQTRDCTMNGEIILVNYKIIIINNQSLNEWKYFVCC